MGHPHVMPESHILKIVSRAISGDNGDALNLVKGTLDFILY